LLEEAPGLTVLAQHLPFDFEKHSLQAQRRALEKLMQAHKLSR
jgi:hypothetical protein